jgi:hypothetical protein
VTSGRLTFLISWLIVVPQYLMRGSTTA